MPVQQVWLYSLNLDRAESRKLVGCWRGPWTIMGKVNDLMYRIKPDPEWRP